MGQIYRLPVASTLNDTAIMAVSTPAYKRYIRYPEDNPNRQWVDHYYATLNSGVGAVYYLNPNSDRFGYIFFSDNPFQYGYCELGLTSGITYVDTFNSNNKPFLPNVNKYGRRSEGIYNTNDLIEFYLDPYNSLEDAIAAIADTSIITYRLVNCTAPSAPQSAISGSTVNVNLQFPEGFGIINPENDVYVTNNGTRIPSTYNNGLLTFTMP